MIQLKMQLVSRSQSMIGGPFVSQSGDSEKMKLTFSSEGVGGLQGAMELLMPAEDALKFEFGATFEISLDDGRPVSAAPVLHIHSAGTYRDPEQVAETGPAL